ncbi:MAG TPA: hypothetical protein VNV61_19100 [Steroidobacteraceae bacterium]|nr:hypothetical protein [Steroidobacteraceae bacterium]
MQRYVCGMRRQFAGQLRPVDINNPSPLSGHSVVGLPCPGEELLRFHVAKPGRFFVSILLRLEKLYAFAFYVQYRICTTRFGSEEWGEQNAVFMMGLFQCFLLLELICGVALLTGHTPIAFPKLATLIGLAAILLFTHRVLVHKHQWLRYKSEFEQYPRRKHFFASLGIGAIMAVAFLGIGIVKKAIGAVH